MLADLPHNDYLIRHEVVVLLPEGPRWYTQRAQLTVCGSDTEEVGPVYRVTIPGVYKMSDASVSIDFGTDMRAVSLFHPLARNEALHSLTRCRTPPFRDRKSASAERLLSHLCIRHGERDL